MVYVMSLYSGVIDQKEKGLCAATEAILLKQELKAKL